MRRWVIIAVAVLAVTMISGAGYLGFRSAQGEENPAPAAPPTVPVERGDVQQTVVAPGQVMGMKEVVLGMDVSGRLAEINVRPGDAVRAGMVLARLEATPLEDALEVARLALEQAEADHERQLADAQQNLQIARARLEQVQARYPGIAAAEASRAAALAELQKVQAGATEAERIAARAELANAEAAVQQAQAAYDRVKWRNDIGALPESQQLQQATNAYTAAKARYDALVHGPSAAALASAQARVQQAQAEYDRALGEQSASGHEIAILEAQVEQATIALERLQVGVDPLLAHEVARAEADLAAATLTAPFDGVVLDVMAKTGETIQAGAGVMLLADPTAIEVRTTVIEEDLPLVRTGQPVEIFFDAYPEEAIQGRVTRIVPQRVGGEDRPLYHVYVAPDRVPERVVPGMTADSSIIIAQRADVLRLPRALARARSDGTAQVKVWVNGQAETRAVRVGLRGDVYVEILEGLREGEEVVGE